MSYIEGVLTADEITNRLIKIHNEDEDVVRREVYSTIALLRGNGFIDSFGAPNADVQEIQRTINHEQEKKQKDYPVSSKDIMLFWDGTEHRYLYSPRGLVKKISQSFYQNLPEDAFEFLFFAKGRYSLSEIANKLHSLYSNKENYSNLTALNTVKAIEEVFRAEEVIF